MNIFVNFFMNIFALKCIEFSPRTGEVAKEVNSLEEDVVHEWLSSNGLSQHYAVYSENHITTLFQG